MNLLCIGVTMLTINTIGVAMFDLNNFPDWAKDDTTDMTSFALH